MSAVAELSPQADESLEDFTSRVHGSLDGVPTAERQQAAFEAWEATHGDPLEEMGVRLPFDRDKFTRVRNVPVFAEHTTKDKEGKLVVYDRAALKAIADRCNNRIRDTGDFAPLTAGHTPDKDQLAAGASQPDVLGYDGPFRLGLLGNDKPRWAIFADEWHDNAERTRIAKLRRRSPEVWLEERMEDRILDPIAALGAETPRLDLGLTKLCRLADGREVAKYQRYQAAAFPGAANVATPTFGSKKKMYDAAGTGQSNTGASISQLTPEVVDQLITALSQTEPFQYLLDLMSQGPQHAVEQDDELAPEEPTEESAEQEEQNVGDKSTIPEQGEEALDDQPKAPKAGKEEKAQDFLKDEEFDGPDEKKSYSAMSDDDKKCYASHKRGFKGLAKKYAALPEASVENEAALDHPAEGDAVNDEGLMQTRNQRGDLELKARYARDVKELNERVAKMERERQEDKAKVQATERYSKLRDLRHEYAFEVEDEYEAVKDYSPAQFDRHVSRMVANYQRIPIGVELYTPPLEEANAQRASKEIAEECVRRVESARADGKQNYSYEQARAEVLKERGRVA